MTYTTALAYRILLHYRLASVLPSRLREFVERQIIDKLFPLTNQCIPMHRHWALTGLPFIGKMVCEDTDCRHSEAIYSPDGVTMEQYLDGLWCRRCDQQTGVLA